MSAPFAAASLGRFAAAPTLYPDRAAQRRLARARALADKVFKALDQGHRGSYLLRHVLNDPAIFDRTPDGVVLRLYGIETVPLRSPTAALTCWAKMVQGIPA